MSQNSHHIHACSNPTARCSYIKLIKDDQINIEVDGLFFILYFFLGFCRHLLGSVMEHLEGILVQMIANKWPAKTENGYYDDLLSQAV